MRISDWSSDVCSSDLRIERFVPNTTAWKLVQRLNELSSDCQSTGDKVVDTDSRIVIAHLRPTFHAIRTSMVDTRTTWIDHCMSAHPFRLQALRSVEGRVGKEWASKGKCRWVPE